MRARLAVPLALLALSLLALASCSVDGPPASKPDAAPLEHIAGADSALQRFSAALVAGDSITITSLAGEHFTLVEDGRTLDLEATLGALHAMQSQGRLSRSLGKLTTHLKGRVAWSHYHVTGEVQGPGAAVAFKRVETAVLERDSDERWRVMLMSSMPEPAPH